MNALHQRLLDAVALMMPASARGRVHPAVPALRAVVELHAPAAEDGIPMCVGCEFVWTRCPTVAAIAEQLGVETA